MRCRIPAVATIAGNPGLVVGVGYGLSGWANPVNAWGVRILSASSIGLGTYDSGTKHYLNTNLGSTYSSLKRGASEVDNDGYNISTYGHVPCDVTDLGLYGAYFNKTGPNITCGLFGTSYGGIVATLENIVYALEQPTPTGVTTYLKTLVDTPGYYDTPASGLALMTVSQLGEATYGGMDSVFVHWTHNDPPLEIADIVVAKWA